MEKAYALVNVRDINLLCQHYKTYAQIEGQTRRRKITRARRRKGVLEVRTAARDEAIRKFTESRFVSSILDRTGVSFGTADLDAGSINALHGENVAHAFRRLGRKPITVERHRIRSRFRRDRGT